MADPDRERTNNRLSMIAFILMAVAGLLAIIFVRPVPAQERAAAEITRSV